MTLRPTADAGLGLGATRRGLAAFCVVAGVAAAPAPAGAEVKANAQAVAAHAEWLAYAPAPATPAAVCLVDSGVTMNADTPQVIRRVALDGGTVDDVDGERHGTLMAMVAAAPVNDQGMVGVAPQNRIVSVRSATPPEPGQPTSSPYYRFAQGIKECVKHQPDGVNVIELALGSSTQATPDETAEIIDQVTKAHTTNLNVVAAAGNDGGAVNDPASAPGILSVGADDRGGAFCSFSARGDGLDVLAPGCGLETADAVTLAPNATQGTSQASAFLASVLAALRAYRPDLSWSDAEQLLTSTAPSGVLNVEAAFRAAGLGGVVDAGRTAIPAVPPPLAPGSPAGVASSGASTPLLKVTRPKAWVTPKATVRWRKGVVSVVVRNAPRLAVVRVQLQRRRGRGYLTVNSRQGRDTIWRLKSPRRPGRVMIRFVDLAGTGHDSRTLTVSKFLR